MIFYLLVTVAVVSAVVLIAALWAIGVYNKAVKSRALVDEAWSGIDVQLKRRYDLVPNLVATVEGYGVHERSVFENVTKARSVAMHAHSIDDKMKAESQLASTLKTLFAVAENYPVLKAADNFLSLQRELSTIEQEIQFARRYYNGATRAYNTLITTFPHSLVAQSTGFGPRAYFEITESGQKEAPKVSFKQ